MPVIGPPAKAMSTATLPTVPIHQALAISNCCYSRSWLGRRFPGKHAELCRGALPRSPKLLYINTHTQWTSEKVCAHLPQIKQHTLWGHCSIQTLTSKVSLERVLGVREELIIGPSNVTFMCLCSFSTRSLLRERVHSSSWQACTTETLVKPVGPPFLNAVLHHQQLCFLYWLLRFL